MDTNIGLVLLVGLVAALVAGGVAAVVVVVAGGRSGGRGPGGDPATPVPVVPVDPRLDVFDRSVTALSTELERLRGAVAGLQRDGAAQHGQLVAGLEHALRTTSDLQATTARLHEALANSRARGQWGERLADDVLRAAGLVEGVSYVRQHTLPDGGRPDITFLLPEDRRLHMDVKFPLDNYLRVLDAAGDAERVAATRQFVRDVRDRVRELSARSYTDPASTVGFVLLFIPNESVYGFLHEHDPALADEALGRQVVLCSPFTLFAVLGVVRQAVDTFRLARTGDEILDCLAGVRREWDKAGDALDKLGRQLGTVSRTYDELAGTRRRQLQRQLDRVEALQAARSEPSPPAAPPGASEPAPGLGQGSVVLPACPAST